MFTSSARNGLIQTLILLLVSPTLLLLSGCAPGVIGAPEQLPPFSNNCQSCARWMEGSFTNASQARRKGASEHYWLHQARIWPDRSDGIWLYSEFGLAGAEATPLQQVVYRLNDNLSGGLVLDSFQLPGDPRQYAGDWRTPTAFNTIDRMTLSLMAGCTIDLQRSSSGELTGESSGTDCRSRLPRSRYQQTRYRIGSMGLTLWLNGYDESGERVFGPGPGGFEMSKLDSSKAPVSIKPGSDAVPDIGPYNLEAEDDD
ncbi:MAG: chromophore lyase CpcT/CpeT [Planctomycetota bacterium]|nr:chromophore lyase CpcT/CpeT [Planctomycetota bacterium]